MLAWIATIGLRAKVLGLAALAVLALVGGLWARWLIMWPTDPIVRMC